MKIHPAAKWFPLLEGEAFDALVRDIEEHGQQEPIHSLNGMLVDGRNRFRACQKLKIDPWIEELEAGTDCYALVMSENFHRRHLKEHEQGKALKAYAEHRGAKRQPGKRKKDPTSPTMSEVAAELGIPQQTASRQIAAAETYERLPAGAKRLVDKGEATVDVAAKVASKVEKLTKAKTLTKDQAQKAKAIWQESSKKQADIEKALSWARSAASGAVRNKNFICSRRWQKAERDSLIENLKQARKTISEILKELTK